MVFLFVFIFWLDGAIELLINCWLLINCGCCIGCDICDDGSGDGMIPNENLSLILWLLSWFDHGITEGIFCDHDWCCGEMIGVDGGIVDVNGTNVIIELTDGKLLLTIGNDCDCIGDDGSGIDEDDE